MFELGVFILVSACWILLALHSLSNSKCSHHAWSLTGLAAAAAALCMQDSSDELTRNIPLLYWNS